MKLRTSSTVARTRGSLMLRACKLRYTVLVVRGIGTGVVTRPIPGEEGGGRFAALRVTLGVRASPCSSLGGLVSLFGGAIARVSLRKAPRERFQGVIR
jgi:hypothetical protein